MTSEAFLRIADTLLALLWAGVLLQSLRHGYVGPRTSAAPTRRARPAYYWSAIFIFALMVVHFGGLAVVGQKL